MQLRDLMVEVKGRKEEWWSCTMEIIIIYLMFIANYMLFFKRKAMSLTCHDFVRELLTRWQV